MRTSGLASAIVIVLLLAFDTGAQQPASRRQAAPALTNEDVLYPRASRATSEEKTKPLEGGSSPLRNARVVLEGALTKMSEVTSIRTRVQTFLPAGEREMLIESIKPDRTHLVSADSEMIVIGRKFYMKNGGTWQVTSMPAGKGDLGLDFRTFVKEMTGKSGVRISGQVVGSQMLDGVETVAYEFAVTDGSETGTIQVCVGKQDGYMRRIFLLGGQLEIKIWFTDINQPISIEAPL